MMLVVELVLAFRGKVTLKRLLVTFPSMFQKRHHCIIVIRLS